MKQSYLIVGAGVMGLTLAKELLDQGYAVHILEQRSREEHPNATAFAAGGMLAPYSELETAEPCVAQWGLESLRLWPAHLKSLPREAYLRQEGSLILSHPRDEQHFSLLVQRITGQAPKEAWSWVRPAALEPELQGFNRGIFLPWEAHLDTRDVLHTLVAWIDAHPQATLEFGRAHCPDTVPTAYTAVIDCRGFGAADRWDQLRALRGEALLVRAPDVHLKRPIRLMHPRYAVYIVPRADHHYYIGATSIESASTASITVRSTLELLSAAYSVQSAFGEATVVESFQGLRPALPHHRPEVRVSGRLLRVNGLYRHGFLLAPSLAQRIRYFLEDKPVPDGTELFRFV